MDQKILNQIKQDLLAKRAELQQDLSEFAKENKNVANKYVTDFPDYGDQPDENAQEVSQYSTNLETGRVLENTLKDIARALKAIEKGTYGICKHCGQEIEEKRLLVRPFSSACVKCKIRLQANR